MYNLLANTQSLNITNHAIEMESLPPTRSKQEVETNLFTYAIRTLLQKFCKKRPSEEIGRRPQQKKNTRQPRALQNSVFLRKSETQAYTERGETKSEIKRKKKVKP